MNLPAGIISAIGGLLFAPALCEPVWKLFLGAATAFHHIALYLQLASGPVLFFNVTTGAGF